MSATLTQDVLKQLVERAEAGEFVRSLAVRTFPDATEEELGRIESAIYDAMQYGEA